MSMSVRNTFYLNVVIYTRQLKQMWDYMMCFILRWSSLKLFINLKVMTFRIIHCRVTECTDSILYFLIWFNIYLFSNWSTFLPLYQYVLQISILDGPFRNDNIKDNTIQVLYTKVSIWQLPADINYSVYSLFYEWQQTLLCVCIH